MDYYSITTSELEWRSSICFCGSLLCRGTFLHYAAQEELQQILDRSGGPAWRVATLLRGCCSETSELSSQELSLLKHHGIGDIALAQNSPSWLKRYAVDTIRFLEYERKALPCALMRSKPMNSSSSSSSATTIANTSTSTSSSSAVTQPGDNLVQSQYTFVTADGDARSVLEQRMQSLLCSLSLISNFLSKQKSEKIRNQMPLKILSVSETIARIWNLMKTIPVLLKKYLIQPLAKHINAGASAAAVSATTATAEDEIETETGEALPAGAAVAVVGKQSKKKTSQSREKLEILKMAQKKINSFFLMNNSLPPVTMSALRTCIREIREVILSIQQHSTSVARLVLLSDVLAMWCHTTTFVEIQRYDPVVSEPIEVVARELGTTTIGKEKLLKYIGQSSLLSSSSVNPNHSSNHSSNSSLGLIQKEKTETGVDEKSVSDEEESTSASANADASVVNESTTVHNERAHDNDDVENSMEISSIEEISTLTPSPSLSPSTTATTISTLTPQEALNNTNGHHSSNPVTVTEENGKTSQRGGYRKRKSSAATAAATAMVSLNPNDVIYSGTRQYSSTYIFWQLISWFNAGTEQENDHLDLLGTSYLPLPSSCFGYSSKDYSSKTRDALFDHWYNEKTLSLPFPSILRSCFSQPNPSTTSGSTSATSVGLSDTSTSPSVVDFDVSSSHEFLMLGSPVLDVGLGQVDAVENCLKEIFGSSYQRKLIQQQQRKSSTAAAAAGVVTGAGAGIGVGEFGEQLQQYDFNLPPEKPTAWVQCESCLKWRRVPFHVSIESLPDQWYCHENNWDLDKATCDYPQDNFDTEKETTLQTTSSTTTTAITDASEAQSHNQGKQKWIEPVKEGDWKDVYCLRNEVFYEAKAIKVRTVKKGEGKGEEQVEIKFHFKGWKPSQDEWIELGSDRIAPYHLYTNVTSKSVRDQEKWQGKKVTATAATATAAAPSTTTTTPKSKPSATTKKGTKRKGNGENDKLLQKKSKNSV
jgi:hypothetical protein